MGQKIHPLLMRLGFIKHADSNWYADKQNYPEMIYRDYLVRELLKKDLNKAGLSHINIEREGPNRAARITIYCARPANVIGRKGDDIESLRKKIKDKMNVPVHVNVVEVKKF